MSLEVTREDIGAAAARIGWHVRRTPLLSQPAALGDGYRLHLKLETMQRTGSFKVRGAFSLLTEADPPDAGVVAASGGNFGLAVACAALDLGLQATVFVPTSSPPEKVERISRYSATVRTVSGNYPEALAAAREWAARTGALEAHAYDQAAVVAGQGTCALEITEDMPGIDTILVAVGGGGLIGGISSWVRDDVKVVAVESELCPTMYEARRHGGPVAVEVGGIAVSSLGASQIGEHAWFANRWVDESVLVGESVIPEAQRALWDDYRVVAEPAGAAPLAALIGGTYVPSDGESVVAVISGGNTHPGSVA